MIAKEYRDNILAEIKASGLPIEVLEVQVKTDFADGPRNSEITRLYLTSKVLGGLIAANGGGGWTPCFPEEPNYPMKGRWFVPPSGVLLEDWRKCVQIALKPDKYWRFKDRLHNATVTERALKLRDPFRAEVAASALDQLIQNGSASKKEMVLPYGGD